MSGPRRGIRRLFHLGLWGPAVDEGVEWEIEHHIRERADELEAEGLSRAEAEREARRLFGDVRRVRREMRAVDRGAARRRRVALWLETVGQDVRYGLRGLVRHSGFAASLVTTLGLGLGATVAVFAMVDALLLRPLPYSESDELAIVMVKEPGGYGMPYIPAHVVRDWRDRGEVFDGSFAHRRGDALYTGGAEPLELSVQRVGASFEEVLGVAPALGRGLVPSDAAPGAEPVALLSHAFWSVAFGGDPAAVGQRIELDGSLRTVVGVMPRGFKFPEYSTTEVWAPLSEESLSGGYVNLLVRVPDGAMAATEARLGSVAAGLFEGVKSLEGRTLGVTPLEETRGGRDEIRQPAWLLFGAVGLILLVAVVNGSNLLLVRTSDRGRELAVRLAVGASRPRVVRQLVTETLALSLLSGAVAVVVALVAVRGMQAILPESLAFFLPHALAVEQRALTFAFAVAAATGLLLALLPALRSAERAQEASAGGLTTYGFHGRSRSHLRRGLVVAEVALSVILLTGAGLLLNSFLRLTAIDIGVRTENLALLNLHISPRAHADSAALATFLPRLEGRVRGIPGVQSATATGRLPVGRLNFGVELQAEGQPPAGGDPDVLPIAEVSPDFFDVTGARLLAGRPFEPGDDPGRVAIVDEDLARHLWPDGEAVGRRFRTGPNAEWRDVVGVVADIQLERRDDREGDFEVLWPFDAAAPVGAVTVAIRTSGEPAAVFSAVRAALREVAPAQPIEELVSAETAYAETIQIPRFLALLVTALAAFALLLAAVGLFGVLSYEVARRRRELGVRMAIGAGAASVRRIVVREGLVLALAGAALGLGAGIGLARFLRGMLFDLEPTDPATLVAVAATVLLTAAVASYLPARRATGVDPAEVLRAE